MGWRSVFYFTGTFTILWFAFWMVDVCDDPKKHMRIKPRELKRIMSKTCMVAPHSQVKPTIPRPADRRTYAKMIL